MMERVRTRLRGVSPRARRVAGTVTGLGIAALALALAARGTDTAGLAAAFGAVSWWWIAAAAAANCVVIVAQGWAWRIGITAGGMGKPALRHAIAATWVGKAGNQLLPGKVGEIARIAMIRTHLPHERREIGRIVGSLAAQRVLSSAATLLIIALVATTVPLPVSPPGGRFAPLALLALLVVAVVAAARLLPRRTGPPKPGRLRALARSFAGGAGVLRPDRMGAATFGLHLVGIAANLVMLQCLLRGFDVAAPPTAPMLIIVLVAIAGAVPGAPGGAGMNQAALVAPLGMLYDVGANTAFAFSLGLQATVAAVAVAGALVALAVSRTLPTLRTAPA